MQNIGFHAIRHPHFTFPLHAICGISLVTDSGEEIIRIRDEKEPRKADCCWIMTLPVEIL